MVSPLHFLPRWPRAVMICTWRPLTPQTKPRLICSPAWWPHSRWSIRNNDMSHDSVVCTIRYDTISPVCTIQSCVKTFLLSFENHTQKVLLHIPKLHYGAIFQPSIPETLQKCFTLLCTSSIQQKLRYRNDVKVKQPPSILPYFLSPYFLHAVRCISNFLSFEFQLPT